MPPLTSFVIDLASTIQNHHRDLSVTAEPVAERARTRARDLTILRRGTLAATVQVDAYDLRKTGNLVAQIRRPGDRFDVVIATPRELAAWFANVLLPELSPARALAGVS